MNTIPLFATCETLLLSADPAEKVLGLRKLFLASLAGELAIDQTTQVGNFITAGIPSRLPLVPAKEVPRRRLQSKDGRAAMIHAILHIEFNAINLALDAIYRFRGMPGTYYEDWLRVACEEAYHYSLLALQLKQLGYEYGDFPAHNGLWEMAKKTGYDVLARMALVPRLMEARGLDVAPGLAQRFLQIRDQTTADILGIIFHDEISHVRIGNYWFHYLCQQRQQDPMTTFLDLLAKHAADYLRGPFDYAARRKAGFTEKELEWLSEV